MSHYIFGNNRGQSLVEAAVIMTIIILILSAMLSIGLYIYNMTVFVTASNKALDKGVSILTGDKPEYSDGIDDNELSDDDIYNIKQTALNALNIKVLVSEMDEEDVLVTTEEMDSDNEILLTVEITGSFNSGLPVAGVIIPQLKYKCTYTYERR